MIIKSDRIATTSSARRLLAHLFHGDDNDEITVLQGGERDILDAWSDARRHGAVKAVRVWIVSPHEAMTREHLFDHLKDLAREFGFDSDRATVVEHAKPRVTVGAHDRHWHVAVAEVDPASGRVLSSSHDRARHEYLARVTEHRLGHPFTLGTHTASVLARLRREGRSAVADALDAALSPRDPSDGPREAFSTRQHRLSKRRGIDLPEVRQLVAAAWDACSSLSGLKATLAQGGLDLAPGEVPGEWIVGAEGELVGSLRRLTRSRKAPFEARMREIIDHDGYGSDPGTDDGRPDPDGDPGYQAGTGHLAVLRKPVGTASGGRVGIFHGGDDAPSRSHDGRDRGDAPAPRSDADDPPRPTPYGGVAGGDPRNLIETATATVTAVFQQVLRAKVSARPASARIESILSRHEEGEGTASAKPVRPASVDLSALRAREKAARADVSAITAEIDAVDGQISGLIIDQRKRRRSLWRRWLPDRDTDVLIAGLRDRRDLLRSQAGTLAAARLRAEIETTNGRNAQVRNEARAKADRDTALKAAARRTAILGRARTLLSRVPALAYIGARRLIEMATRVESAREHGYDPGPRHTA